MVAAAETLIRDLCHDKDGWEYDGIDEAGPDIWGAERVLVFRREDYVRCYAGFHGSTALYVLQRIE